MMLFPNPYFYQYFNFASRKKRPPKLYIQGDLHGSESWKRFFQAYKRDPYPEKYFIFLGDISDPGHPNWKALPKIAEERYRMDGELEKIDAISRAIRSDPHTYLILGNHEALRLAPFAKYLDPSYTLFTRKARDFEQYKYDAPDVAMLWIATVDHLKRLIDGNRGKIFIAKTFGDNVVLSHGGFSNLQLYKCADPDKPVTSRMVLDNFDDYFAPFKGYNKLQMSRQVLPGTIQIFGHYAGIKEFPTIVEGPMGARSYCVDDNILIPGPDKRGFVYYVGDDTFEVFR